MRSWRPTALRPEKEPATLADLGARVQRAQATIPFVLDGQVLAENLTTCGKDAAWLERTAQANSLLLEEILILAGNDTEDYFLLKKEPRQTAGLRLLAAAVYSSFRVQQFAEDISDDIDTAMEDIRNSDLTGARQALAEGAELCDTMREGMNHLLRTQDFTELEAALRAADGHLELNAPEEAFGELRRAQVQVETLAWLSHRIL